MKTTDWSCAAWRKAVREIAAEPTCSREAVDLAQARRWDVREKATEQATPPRQHAPSLLMNLTTISFLALAFAAHDVEARSGVGHQVIAAEADRQLPPTAQENVPRPARPAKPVTTGPPGLSQKDGVLFKDGKPYRGVGANYFDLFLRVLHTPTNTTSLTGLQQLGAAGIPFVRFAAAFGEGDWKPFFNDQEEFFRRLDLVVRTAERANVGLVPSFFWDFMSFADLANERRDQWGNPESQTTARMRQVVGAIVERYKESPALWAWEFGNEPNLLADLPNAAEFRKPGGTERDDLHSKDMIVMLAEFAKEVRRHDPHRPIIAGHSHPRASAWHNTAEKSWKADSREQTVEIIRRDNPAPLDTLAIHIYAADAAPKELGAWPGDHAEYLRVVRALAREMRRPVFIGEFGLASKDGETGARAKFEKLLADMEQAEVDLAAFWVFDLTSQNNSWNATFDNDRAYMLKLTAEANHRWNKAALPNNP